MVLLVLLVFAICFPVVGALIWWGLVTLVEITVCLLQVLAVLALLAIRLLAALTRWAWDAWRRSRRATPPQQSKAPAAMAPEKIAPVLASGHWWDAIPDDAFVPPLNWRLRKAIGLPAPPLPRVAVSALTPSPSDLPTLQPSADATFRPDGDACYHGHDRRAATGGSDATKTPASARVAGPGLERT